MIKNNFKSLFNFDNRIIGLDLVRFIAIFYVFWQHGLLLIPDELKKYYSILTFFPVDGVSIFFVLSGFLIGKILLKSVLYNKFTFKDLIFFWLRRWMRTLPNYFVVLFILLICTFKIWDYNFLYFIFSQNLFYKHPEFFMVAWSLSVEEWFYFLFPFFVFFNIYFFKMKDNAIIFSIIIFILLPLILRIINEFFLIVEPYGYVRKVVFFRMDSMMYGVLAAFISVKYSRFWNKFKNQLLFFGLGILLIITIVVKFHFLDNLNLYNNVFTYNIESILVILFLPYLSNFQKFKYKILNKIIVFTSKISYSLYLTHASIVLWFIIRELQVNEIFDYLRYEFQVIIYFSMYIILSVLFSLILYIFIEQPFMKLRDKITK